MQSKELRSFLSGSPFSEDHIITSCTEYFLNESMWSIIVAALTYSLGRSQKRSTFIFCLKLLILKILSLIPIRLIQRRFSKPNIGIRIIRHAVKFFIIDDKISGFVRRKI